MPCPRPSIVIAGVIAVLALALFAPASPVGPAAARLFGFAPIAHGSGCYTDMRSGFLEAADDGQTISVAGETTALVLWPEGYGARYTPSGEIEVLDRAGGVVAVTGTTVRLAGGFDYRTDGRAPTLIACGVAAG